MSGRAERLFGTDGVRGVAGEHLSAELALRLGQATVAVAGRPGVEVLVLRDPRQSGEMLEAAFAAGVAAAGGVALLGGVLPTPAAPILQRVYGLPLAAVISASHNPYQDNGIKLFGGDGFKLDDNQERAVEEAVAQPPAGRTPGRIRLLEGCLDQYLQALQDRFGKGLAQGRRIALDCANGATYRAAPALLRRLGGTVEAFHAAPDGLNINRGCGSTAPQFLQRQVVEGGFDMGFAFDGDGDRVVAVDQRGRVVDGDELIALIARHLQQEGQLGGGVVLTVMSNLGLFKALQRWGIETAQTPVGDRHVLAALRARGWRLGGEQSGHIIDLRYNGCGDGLATALHLLEALGDKGLEAGQAFRRLPQELRNVKVADRRAAVADRGFQEELVRAEGELGAEGRVVVRPSGTEPVVRVMVEAPSAALAQTLCARLAKALEAAASRSPAP